MWCEDWSNQSIRRRVLISRIASLLCRTPVSLHPMCPCFHSMHARPETLRLSPGEVFPRPSFSSSSNHLWACPICLLPCQERPLVEERPMLALGANDRNQAGRNSSSLVQGTSKFDPSDSNDSNGSKTCSLPSRPPQQPSIGQVKTKTTTKCRF